MITLLLQTTSGSSKISESIHQFDPYGLGISVIGMGVVFISLLVLYLAFFNVSKLLLMRTRKNLKKQGQEAAVKDKKIAIDSDISAAIAAALSLYFQEVHDKEEAVLTISKTARTYSPWSSKIYGLRNYPR